MSKKLFFLLARIRITHLDIATSFAMLKSATLMTFN